MMWKRVCVAVTAVCLAMSGISFGLGAVEWGKETVEAVSWVGATDLTQKFTVNGAEFTIRSGDQLPVNSTYKYQNNANPKITAGGNYNSATQTNSIPQSAGGVFLQMGRFPRDIVSFPSGQEPNIVGTSTGRWYSIATAPGVDWGQVQEYQITTNNVTRYYVKHVTKIYISNPNNIGWVTVTPNAPAVTSGQAHWFECMPINFLIANWDYLPTSINTNGNGTANEMQLLAVDQIMSGVQFSTELGVNANKIWSGPDNRIRNYLNEKFLVEAFTPEEQSIIATTVVQNHTFAAAANPNQNKENLAYNGTPTQDKVFLLSTPEILGIDTQSPANLNSYSKLFADGTGKDLTHITMNTDWSVANYGSAYAIGNNNQKPTAAGWWWSRTPASATNFTYVGDDGTPSSCNPTWADGGLRPALTLDLGIGNPKIISGVETTPNIDVASHTSETIGNFSPNAEYKISYASNQPQTYTPTSTTIEIDENWFGETLQIVKVGTQSPDETWKEDSLAQSLSIPARPSAPSGLGHSGGNAITGTTAGQEYRLLDGDNWADCTAPNTPVASGTYLVRVKASDMEPKTFASAPATVVVSPLPQNTWSANELTINYEDETVEGFVDGKDYKVYSDHFTAIHTTIAGTSFNINLASNTWYGRTLHFIKCGNGTTTSDSQPLDLHIPARPTMPNITFDNVSEADAENGIIKNLTTSMEWATADGYVNDVWQPVTGDNIQGLHEGTYYVRIKATTTSFASAPKIINIVVLTGGEGEEGRHNGGDKNNITQTIFIWAGVVLLVSAIVGASIGGTIVMRAHGKKAK